MKFTNKILLGILLSAAISLTINSQLFWAQLQVNIFYI